MTNREIVKLIEAAKTNGKLPANYRYGRVFRPTTRFQVSENGKTRILGLDEFLAFISRKGTK